MFKVNISFSKDQVLPGEKIQLSLNASPNASCGYDIVDKSVLIQGGDNHLTLSDIVDRVRRYVLQRREWVQL